MKGRGCDTCCGIGDVRDSGCVNIPAAKGPMVCVVPKQNHRAEKCRLDFPRHGGAAWEDEKAPESAVVLSCLTAGWMCSVPRSGEAVNIVPGAHLSQDRGRSPLGQPLESAPATASTRTVGQVRPLLPVRPQRDTEGRQGSVLVTLEPQVPEFTLH